MSNPSRRRLLRVSSGIAGVAFAGCVGTGERGATASPSPSPSPSPPNETSDETAEETAPLTAWERSTDCDAMHDSVVRVERVRNRLGDEYAPIDFESLSDGEKRILRAVTEAGGYGTCDAGDAFQRFVERVSEHGSRQEADAMRVYLERGGTYYGLYVEKLDQVYAY